MSLGVPEVEMSEAEIKALGIGAEAPALGAETTAGDKPSAPRGQGKEEQE